MEDKQKIQQLQEKLDELTRAMNARVKKEQQQIHSEESNLFGYVVSNLTKGIIIEHSDFAPNAPDADRTRSYQENIVSSLSSVVYEDDRIEFIRIHNNKFLLSEFKQGKTSFSIEFRRRQPDGLISWVRNVLHVVEDPKTTEIYLYEYCYDINATKSVEVVTNAAIIETFDCLASIDLIHDQTTYLSQENIRMGKNVVLDIYHNVTESYIRRLVVKEEQELCTQTFSIEYIREKLENESKFEFTYHIQGLDENIHTMRNKYVYYDRKKHRCLLTRTDVTAIIQQEKEQRHYLQMAQVMDSIPGGIVILDTQPDKNKRYPIIFCAQGVADLAGYTVDEFVDLYENYTDQILFKSDQAAVREQMDRLVQTKQNMDISYRVIHKDGTLFWIRESANIIIEPDGNEIIVAVFQNISQDARLYQEIIDSSANVIQVIDKETREVYYANEAAIKLTGKRNYAGMRCYEFFGKRTEPCEFCNFRDGKLLTKEMELVQEGKVYLARGNFITWHGRNVYTEILSDITNHKRLQKHYESYLSSVTQTVTDATVAGRINISRDLCFSMKSHIPEFQPAKREMTIKQFIEYVLPFLQDEKEKNEYRDTFSKENLLKQYAQGNSLVSNQQHCELSNGTLIILQSNVQMTLNPESGDIEGVLFARDVTQEAINDQIFTKLLSHKFEGIELIDAINGTCSVRQFQVYGEYATDVKNENYESSCQNAAKYYMHPDDRDLFLENASISNLVKQLKNKELYNFTVRNIIQGKVLVKTCSYCYIGHGQSTIMGTIEDVTDIVSESEKQKEELEEALVLANESTKAKSDFLARMSHDLRTPINTIVGLQTLTLDEIDNPETVRDNLEKMHEATDFMLSLINDLLDMSEIENGKMKMHKEPYQYGDFLSNMKTMFTPQCEKKGISIYFSKPRFNPLVNVDKLKFNRIIFNVLSNAVKYTNTGGIISYHTENLKMEKEKVTVDIIIKDTGIGMSEEFQKHMFEAFSQEDKKVTADLQGSGVGLSITKQLVEQMGGEIRIQSKKGEGTTVTIHMGFDLIDADAKMEPDKVEEKEMQWVEQILHGKQILLAEDHQLNAQIAKKLLEKDGIEVTLAENGLAAVNYFEESKQGFFDAILMDIRMPEMDGLETTRTIRSLKRDDARTVPIIAMSANAYEEDIEKSKEAGMNAHLAKPVEPKKLRRVLSELISKKEERYGKVQM